ncbi:uncharacterized protein LOC133863283 [Alnus glutinosa]|uniref:uncharacterized protein LOC133863283 n=1 Tax=Alnus glutinosa TaxID=3517 RepID=UPI002D770EE7|nr:uncharacterized protein LOC133863283 [Alnus glutinosa]
MQATLGNSPSYAWRSVHNAREVLERGLIWRVGNGEKVRIWGDCWIPSSSNFKVHSSVAVLNSEDTVSKLIDQTLGWWNYLFIQRIFGPQEAKLICSVPISPLKSSDCLIWRGTTHGCFSVKSAYHMEVGHNLLPTKANLAQKMNNQDPSCPICQQQVEIVFHILWECPSSMTVWQEGSRRIQKLVVESDDGLGLGQQLLLKLETEEFVKAMTVARLIWLRQNAFVFRNEFASPMSIVLAAKENLETYFLVHRKEELVNSPSFPLEMWSKPKMGWIKLNWDAALDIPAKKLGLRVVVRDSCWVLVVAKATVVPFISNPTTGEALAAWSATTLARELGL